ncbi:DUF3306 domain-containing protein [Salinarimonas rosea]|uniref:DUF3306 domain-containing protein n=1 Tax=Salinarimonas rosea TaxID=552063 RepID=UPI0004108672|nr:DUF3306 domain-containing protein [Salinarimonas rosea]
MSGEGFLSRWSRRKREEDRGEAPEAHPGPEASALPAPAPEPAPEPGPEPEPTLSEEELAALPPIETIDATTDITGFLRKGVPAVLKNAALRRAWATNPAVRDYLDPAREYAYDWNTPGGVPGDGPLGPGFDAKALADRLFGKRETALAEAPRAPEATAEPDPDMGEMPTPSVQSAQHNRDTEPEETPEPASGDEPALTKSTAAHEVSEPSSGRTPAAAPDPRPRPRRHGGATPV